MKKLIIPIIFTFCFTNYISAGEIIANDYKYTVINNEQEKKELSILRLLEYFLIEANKLEITDIQRKKLSNLPEKYIYPLTIKESEYKTLVLTVVDILTNPNFDTDKLKSALNKSKSKALEMSLLSVDAIDEIRQIIGIENFKMLLRPMARKK